MELKNRSSSWKTSSHRWIKLLLIVVWILLLICISVKTFTDTSIDNTNHPPTVRNTKTRLISNELPFFVKDNEGRDNPKLPEFANKVLTGYYRSSLEDSDEELNLYFPWVDLQDSYAPKDEAYEQYKKTIWNSVHHPPQQTMVFMPWPTIVPSSLVGSPSEVAILTRRCFKGGSPLTQINQDRSFLLKLSNNQNFLMGIFDGHGPQGHKVSHYLALELSHHKMLRQLLLQKPQTPHLELRQFFNDTFYQLDQSQPVKTGSGSTCSLLLRLGNRMYVSSVGDSKVFLASYQDNKVQIHLTNREHKPKLKEERERIESMGGTVWVPPTGLTLESSRVIFYLDNGEELALAMSRSIGDSDATPIGVIPEPTIDSFDMEKNIVYLAVVVSDGLLDFIPEEKLLTRLFEVTTTNKKNNKQLLQVCEELMLESSKAWVQAGYPPYRDDITISVHQFTI